MSQEIDTRNLEHFLEIIQKDIPNGVFENLPRPMVRLAKREFLMLKEAQNIDVNEVANLEQSLLLAELGSWTQLGDTNVAQVSKELQHLMKPEPPPSRSLYPGNKDGYYQVQSGTSGRKTPRTNSKPGTRGGRESVASVSKKESNRPSRPQSEKYIPKPNNEMETLRERMNEIAIEKRPELDLFTIGLDDDHGPLKLAEKFRQIFNDDWASALEDLLLTARPNNETNGIKFLTYLFQKLYDLTSHRARHVLRSIIDSTKRILISPDPSNIQENGPPTDVDPDIERNIRRYAINCLRGGASLSLESVQKDTQEMLRDYMKSKGVNKFLYECITLSWYIHVQEPQVVLRWADEGDRYNAELYKVYKGSGSHVDFCVWPAVLLSKEGQLLSRGIVQLK